MGSLCEVDQVRLEDRAISQYSTIREPAVFACWHVIVEAVEQGWLSSTSLPTMIQVLERGGGHGVEEYGLDVIDEQTVEVTFLDERHLCPRDAMLYELKRLANDDETSKR